MVVVAAVAHRTSAPAELIWTKISADVQKCYE
jgi:hypothetical protein